MTGARPMIGILTIDCATSAPAVRLLLDRLGDRVAFVGLSNLYRPGGGGTLRGIRRHFARGGWAWLRYLFHNFTLPQLAGVLLGPFSSRFRTIRQRCRRRGIPVLTVDEAGSAHFLNGRESEAGLLISLYFDQILGSEAIGACTRAGTGIVNVHTARLPAHRGPVPVFYSMLDDPPSLGCTLHLIVSAEIDAGPVVALREATAEPGESVLRAGRRLHAMGAEMLLDLLGDAEGALAGPRPQGEAGASYESFPDRAALAAARRRGVRLV